MVKDVVNEINDMNSISRIWYDLKAQQHGFVINNTH